MHRFFKIALLTLLLTSVSALFAKTVKITNNTDNALTITAKSFYGLAGSLEAGSATTSKNVTFSNTITVSNDDGKCNFTMNSISGDFNGSTDCSGSLNAIGSRKGSTTDISIKDSENTSDEL